MVGPPRADIETQLPAEAWVHLEEAVLLATLMASAAGYNTDAADIANHFTMCSASSGVSRPGSHAIRTPCYTNSRSRRVLLLLPEVLVPILYHHDCRQLCSSSWCQAANRLHRGSQVRDVT